MGKRILFVDDEPCVLAGLRNLLRNERHRWEMVFVESGAHALVELQKQPFDVVVSDMRMPGMDGATLLAAIRARYPSTRCVMLTGYADPDSIARARLSVHELLAKPCNGDLLRRALDHAP